MLAMIVSPTLRSLGTNIFLLDSCCSPSAMVLNNDRVKNEFYVGPVYNYAIQDNNHIRILDCKKMWGLGVPNDLKKFIQDYLKE